MMKLGEIGLVWIGLVYICLDCDILDLTALYWIARVCMDMDCVVLDWIGLHWICIGFAFGFIALHVIQFLVFGLHWIGLHCLHVVGYDCMGLDMMERDWLGLHCIG